MLRANQVGQLQKPATADHLLIEKGRKQWSLGVPVLLRDCFSYLLCLFAFLWPVLAVSPLRAAVVEGFITRKGEPIEGAIVRLKESAQQARVLATKTTKSGYYRLRSVQPGYHLLKVTKEGKELFSGMIQVKEPRTRQDIEVDSSSSK